VRCRPFGRIFLDASELAEPADKTETALPAAQESIYYLADATGSPLYGFFVRAVDGRAVEKLVEALEHFARQRNLELLSNDTTDLGRTLTMAVYKVDGEMRPDPGSTEPRLRITGETPIAPDSGGRYVFKQGEYFRIEVRNDTGQDLYVTLLDLSSDGSIQQVQPFGGPSEKLVNGNVLKTDIYVTTPPKGPDTFVLMAMKKPADFSGLVQGVVQRGANEPETPVEALMQQAMARTRSKPVASVASDNDSWVTKSIGLSVGGAR
jgi:hypothetical protein